MDKRDIIEHNLSASVKRFESRLEYLKTKSTKYSWFRLSVFLISLLLFFYFFFTGNTLLLTSTAILFLISFGILTGIHNKIEHGIKNNIIWTKIKQLHLSRMNLRWSELPRSVFTPDENHPYDFDLNITGEYSLHRLINTSASYEGSEVLKNWLTSTTIDVSEVIERQSLVKELYSMHRFRDKLSLFSSLLSRKNLSGTRISEWINTPVHLSEIKRVLFILSCIIPVNIVLFLLNLLGILPAYYLYTLIIYVGVYWFNSKYTKGIFEDLMEIEEDFGKFSVIFDFLEQYPYRKGSRLQEHCSIFLKHTPSSDFNRIKNTADAVSYTKNPLVGLVFNILFPYNFFFAYRLETIKSRLKTDLPEWLNTWYNLEAYSSLANYAYLNPQCSFPEFNKDIIIKASGINHPLIYPGNVIPNDFIISDSGSVFIITGSNMSGKSTFLKTLGINLVMAYSGGVVNAQSLQVSSFRLHCCINISDSVIDGISYFYAEVKRLKIILDELKIRDKAPVLFLIDEIFRGTNNIERLRGSRSYIKEAVKLNGTGLVSTHDLELSRLESEIQSVKNYHFREEAAGGKMIFDYKLHPGPSPTTNALIIMKAEGLPVED